jgi:hypothetical protein
MFTRPEVPANLHLSLKPSAIALALSALAGAAQAQSMTHPNS